MNRVKVIILSVIFFTLVAAAGYFWKGNNRSKSEAFSFLGIEIGENIDSLKEGTYWSECRRAAYWKIYCGGRQGIKGNQTIKEIDISFNPETEIVTDVSIEFQDDSGAIGSAKAFEGVLGKIGKVPNCHATDLFHADIECEWNLGSVRARLFVMRQDGQPDRAVRFGFGNDEETMKAAEASAEMQLKSEHGEKAKKLGY